MRLGVFLGIFALIAAWELAAPRRRQTVSKARRWFANLTLVTLNTLLLRAVFPTAALGVAALAADGRWGLFNLVALPPWIAMVLSVVLLDLVIYLQHVMFHAVPALWKLHAVHSWRCLPFATPSKSSEIHPAFPPVLSHLGAEALHHRPAPLS